MIDAFFDKIASYYPLSGESRARWEKLLQEKEYRKGGHFVMEGSSPRKVAFVAKGLFSQYYIADSGITVIKAFFPEHRFAASVSAMLTNSPSHFTITALEDTTVLEYDFQEFRKLSLQCLDVAAFYTRYMEKHWIVEKEALEISLRNDTASRRYDTFLKTYPLLVKRLKKHHIAAYLGITPTQLSRILLTNK